MGCRCNTGSSSEDMGYLGSGQKWAITMTCDGFSMDDDDWKVIISCGNNIVEFTKDSAIRDEEGQWYIAVDTKDLGVGKAIITCVAYVPDTDFDNGIRTEIVEKNLITIRSLQTTADVSYDG